MEIPWRRSVSASQAASGVGHAPVGLGANAERDAVILKYETGPVHHQVNEPSPFRWLWVLPVVVGLGCCGVALNPVGWLRIHLIESRLTRDIKGVPRGASPAAIRQFAVREGLRIGDEPDTYFPSYTPPRPPGTVYWMWGQDPYRTGYVGIEGGVAMDFWFDKDKRFISASLDSYGSAL